MTRVLFSGNSFHLRTTRSSLFFVDLLHRFFGAVDVIPHKDLFTALRPQSHDLLVVWQHAFDPEVLAATQVPRIVYVPMYDDLPPSSYWVRLADLGVSVLCFSERLHRLLQPYGLRTLAVRYAPTLPQRCATFRGGLRLFFWPRTSAIGPGTILRWLRHWPIERWHFHGLDAPPPGFPPERVTLSRWYANPADFQAALADFQVFVAPRKREGIGMSFLESLSLGQVVIGWDDATMNEYIAPGRNGFLVGAPAQELEPPTDPAVIGANARASVEDAYRAWIQCLPDLHEFLRQSPPLFRRRTSVRLRELAKSTLRTYYRKLKSLFPTAVGREKDGS